MTPTYDLDRGATLSAYSEDEGRVGRFIYFSPQGPPSSWKSNTMILASPFEAEDGEQRTVLMSSGSVNFISEAKYDILVKSTKANADQGTSQDF